MVTDDVIKELAKELKMDVRVVNTIATHPLKYLKDHIIDIANEESIRIRYLGAFKMKKLGLKKDNSTERIEAMIKEDLSPILIADYEFESVEELHNYLIRLQKKGIYTKINRMYWHAIGKKQTV